MLAVEELDEPSKSCTEEPSSSTQHMLSCTEELDEPTSVQRIQCFFFSPPFFFAKMSASYVIGKCSTQHMLVRASKAGAYVSSS